MAHASRFLSRSVLVPCVTPLTLIPHAATRSLATKGLAKPKELAKPKAQTQRPTLRRRRSFDPDLNPFLQNAGGMGAAENQMRKFMNEGGFEDLEGKGKPLPERHVAPHLGREDAVLDDMVKYLSKERDGLNAEDKAMFKTSALKSEIAAARQKKK